MAITYSWTFSQLEVAPHDEDLVDVVKTVHWRYKGVDGDYIAEVYGSVSLVSPDPDDFIEYDDLNKSTVQDWVEGALGEEQIESMEASIASQIADQKNPKIVGKTPNWN